MRRIKHRIEKLEATFKEKRESNPKPITIEEELEEINEMIGHFYPEHAWCALPFEEQKRILSKFRQLPYPQRWGWRIKENPDKELHLAREVSSLHTQALYTLLNQLSEAEKKGDSAFLLEISKKLKLHFNYCRE